MRISDWSSDVCSSDLQLVARAPGAAVPWMNYGHALKTVGRLEEAVAAYRRSLEIDPANGFAWWGLANLRTVRLSDHDVDLLEGDLRSARDDLHRVQLQDRKSTRLNTSH